MGSIKPPIGLPDALFSKTQRGVFAVLFGNPERSYFVNEIVRLAQSGAGAVNRELAALESAGLVTVNRVGNQKHYRANRDSPIFTELRGIVQKTFGLCDVLREMLAPMARRIQSAFVFGSVAKGNDDASSDIDIMVVGDDIAYTDLFSVMSEAEQRLGRKLNPTIYSPGELQNQLKNENAFVNRVLAQPKLFIICSARYLPERRRVRKAAA